MDDAELPARLADLLTRRGISRFLDAQEAEGSAKTQAQNGYDAGIADLAKAAGMGSERAEQQLEVARDVAQQSKLGAEFVQLVAEANEGANAEPPDWDRAVDRLRKALACATDLTPLRRVQELPLLLLNDAIGHARARDFGRAVAGLSAAARFPRARGRALLLLGKCAARRGDASAAVGHWDQASAAGEALAARECLEALAAMPTPPAARRWWLRGQPDVGLEADGGSPPRSGVGGIRNAVVILRILLRRSTWTHGRPVPPRAAGGESVDR